MDTVDVLAFGKKYPVPKTILRNSALLSSKLGDLSTISNIQLNLEPELQPLLDYLYSRVMSLYQAYGNNISDAVLIPTIRETFREVLPSISPLLLLKYSSLAQMFH